MGKSPDWGKIGAVVSAASLVLALIAYLRPADPAHPVKFDFLWTNISLSLPLWLAALTSVAGLIIILYLANVYRRRPSSPLPTPEFQKRDREIADLKATLARFENQRPPRVAPTAEPAAAAPAPGELIFTSPEDISIKITPNEWQHLTGYVISVVNHRLGAINRAKFTAYSAQSFDARHNDYRDGRDFNAFAKIDPETIDASHSGKSMWFVRKDRGDMLLVGDDSNHPLRWPDADKSSIQRWRLTIAIDSQTVPMKQADAIVVLKQVKIILVLTWDKGKNEFGITEEVQAGQPAKKVPDIAPPDPRLSVIVDEEAKHGLFRSGAAITIKNVGGSEAHNLVLHDLTVGRHNIVFPANIGLLNAGDTTPAILGRVEDYSPLQHHDIAKAMLEVWNDLMDIKIEHMTFPASATYADYQGNRFRASWNYEFLPIKYHVKSLHRDKKEITGQSYQPSLSISAIITERL